MRKSPFKEITVPKQDDFKYETRSTSWCVAFIRFKEPAAAYKPESEVMETKPILVVENDCTSISLVNAKQAMSKTCQLAMKVSDTYYINSVSPGDWVVVFINDKDSIKETAKALKKLDSNYNFTKYDKGMKFIGRVTHITHSDSISSNGIRTVNENISCQSFLEFATSVYYTNVASQILSGNSPFSNKVLPEDLSAVRSGNAGMKLALGNLASAFMNFFDAGTKEGIAFKYHSPDIVVAFHLIILMGVDWESASSTFNNLKIPFKGILSEAISVPKEIALILNRPTAKKLWELYNVFLGLQEYDRTGTWYKSFSPKVQGFQKTGFFKTAHRCKGYVLYRPQQWSGQSIWSIMGGYLNPLLNEMITGLRIGPDGNLALTITVREKPLGTNLYNKLENMGVKAPAFKVTGKDTIDKQVNTKDLGIGIVSDNNTRAMYANLPRWVLDESYITSLSVGTNESNRINLVQVWGTNALASYSTAQSQLKADTNQAVFQETQLLMGNYFSDDRDIKRNGLRSFITETQYDFPLQGQSVTPVWARMVADWMFNGHLKLEGSVSCIGIYDNIQEGDNIEIRGIVFHIESVSHSCSISSNGVKSFLTNISLSNGIVAKSLDDSNAYPMYASSAELYYDGISSMGKINEDTVEPKNATEEVLKVKKS